MTNLGIFWNWPGGSGADNPSRVGGSWINGVEVRGDYLLKNDGPGLAWLVLCFVSLKKVGFSLVTSWH